MYMLFGFSAEYVDRKVKEARSQAREEVAKDHSAEIKTLKSDHDLELRELNKDHELALKEKEFEIKHNADERVAAAEAKATDAKERVAVLEKENEMLGKITDLNADVIDVKKLVNDLIGKLPTVNLTGGIALGSESKKK